MRLEKLLDVIQVQRHDFLNHMQVISGLLQLNKLDRLRDYLGQVSMELARFSKTTRVKIPEVTACLLTAYNDAAMIQVELFPGRLWRRRWSVAFVRFLSQWSLRI